MRPIAPASREPPRSLYVHAPFCEHRCHYCDFSVTRRRRPPVGEWLESIEADFERWFGDRGWSPGAPLETIFVGGGTPSLLGRSAMTDMSAVFGRWFSWDRRGIEWTVEANPRSLTEAVLADWAAAGVSRISIGVQAFDDEALHWLGRLHDAREAEASVRRAREAGFENLNVDMLFGLPEEIRRDWPRELGRVSDLGVPHVSLYGLAAEKRTPLGRWMELGRVRLAGEELYEKDYLTAAGLLSRAGYGHYEVSNLALPGLESRHNWQYWDRSPYLGVGPSAHSFLPPFRVWNVFRWDAYRRAVELGAGLREGAERVTGERERLERLWLGLRTRKGIAAEDPSWRGLSADVGRILDSWEREGWLRRGVRVVLTPMGWLRLDALVAEFARRLPDIEDPADGVADVEKT